MVKLSMARFRLAPSGFVHLFPLLIIGIIALGVVLATKAVKKEQDFRSNAQTTSCLTGEQPASVPGQTLLGAIAGQPYPIWCQNLGKTATDTHTEPTANSWLDEFNHGASFSSFGTTPSTFTSGLTQGVASIDGGYRIFNSIDSSGFDQHKRRTQRWRHANHWMTDMTGGFLGGTTMRPDKSFKFENGKLIVESDFAAGILCYENGCKADGGGIAWGELVISQAPQPTGSVVDSLYSYGYFGGNWTIGCRLHPGGPICAVQTPNGLLPGMPGTDTYPCFSASPNRSIEMSWFQQCGTTHDGGLRAAGGNYAKYFRQCGAVDPDTNCRDRFRMEVSKNGLVLYVNGFKYFEDSGWPSLYQLPDSAVNGDWYAYFADWTDNPEPNVTYRFHWDRIAVNPSTGPSAPADFCPDKPGSICPPGSSTSTPITTPSPSKTPLPTPSPTSTPTVSSTPQPSGQVCTTGRFTGSLSGSQEVPGNTVAGTGNGIVVLNSQESAGTVYLNFSSLSSAQTMAHIHGPATPGQNAGIQVTLPLGQIANYTATLTQTQVNELKNGLYYFNVHTQQLSGGEIRGQLRCIPKAADLNGDNAVDVKDLSILLVNWLTSNAIADVNRDTHANVQDLSIMLSNWQL